MDFYNVILGLYSGNCSTVLDIINSAMHEEMFAYHEHEVVHTGFYCFNHKGTRIGFLYDIKSNELYFQRAGDFSFPLGTIYYSILGSTSTGAYSNVRMHFKVEHNSNSLCCYQGYDTLQQAFMQRNFIPFPQNSYKYFIFKKVEGIHYVEIKNPCDIVFRQLYNGRFVPQK